MVDSPNSKVYFSGDSGYDEHCQKIRDQLEPFDAAFIGSDQYDERWREVRNMPEEAVQAVQASKAVGRPVKLIWAREEDTQHDFYRSACKSLLQVELDKNGFPKSWKHQLAGPSAISEFAWQLVDTRAVGKLLNWIDWDVTSTGGTQLPYAIPAHEMDYEVVEPGIRVGFWRSVGNLHNAFTVESVQDKAADLAGRDPLKYRLALLTDQPRHRNVLDQVAQDAGWGSSLPEGHA